jgi:pimeloyl-ACP methyl ester carboxylesterase
MTQHTALAVAPRSDLQLASRPWLDPELYPFRPRSFATAHGNLSYVDVGHGPVVLLVHGTPSWSFEWRHVIRELSTDHRVVAPDHLGFGLSDKPASGRGGAPLEPADHAERLRTFVTHLGLRDVTLVVHDFGCPIGLPLALGGDGIVGRVVLLNGWMWSNEDDRDVARIDRFVRGWLGRLLYLRMNASPRWLLPAAFGKAFRLEKHVHRHYTAPFGTRAERAAPYALACALAGSNDFYAGLWAKRARLAELPLTIVWGERDPAFGAKHLERWTSAFPHADVVRLADVGHFPAEEAPGAVVGAIRAIGSRAA